jgi:hypothetical protein
MRARCRRHRGWEEVVVVRDWLKGTQCYDRGDMEEDEHVLGNNMGEVKRDMTQR